MKNKDLLVIYGTSSQGAIKLIKAMRIVITELKEQIQLAKEPERLFKEK